MILDITLFQSTRKINDLAFLQNVINRLYIE